MESKISVKCPECLGSGKDGRILDKCGLCEGNGTIPATPTKPVVEVEEVSRLLPKKINIDEEIKKLSAPNENGGICCVGETITAGWEGWNNAIDAMETKLKQLLERSGDERS